MNKVCICISLLFHRCWYTCLLGFKFAACMIIVIFIQHMRSPSVSCLDVDTSLSTNENTPTTLHPSTPTKSHRRSASCGNNPSNNIQGSGPDMRIVRIRMDLQDGNLYRSILVQIPGLFVNSTLYPQLSWQSVYSSESVSGTVHNPKIILVHMKLSHWHYYSNLLTQGYKQW